MTQSGGGGGGGGGGSLSFLSPSSSAGPGLSWERLIWRSSDWLSVVWLRAQV